MKTIYKDHLKRSVKINKPIQKIVSLVPSQTELLCELGLTNKIVGITRFCVHPNHLQKSITRIGGTKSLNINAIRELNPDLIVANKEENNLDDVKQLEKEFSVWVSDIVTYDDNNKLINDFGLLFSKEDQAKGLIKKINDNWKNAPKNVVLNCVYFIWKNPYMLAGKDTFIDAVLLKSGYNNIIHTKRYPSYNTTELSKLNPQIVFLSSEPYSFKEKHINEFKSIFPRAKVILVDGELFSWYGSRIQFLPKYLSSLHKKKP